MKILAIGDPHFMTSNIPEVELFLKNIEILIANEKPDFIVMLGDLLHEHERLHISPLNKAYEFIKILSKYALTFCIVGNHDLINNRQFLTENHWMNVIKEWKNIIVVDKVVHHENCVFVPYVPPGQFVEALNTSSYNWKQSRVIFAHQEFFGCKMGAIVSIEGDKWDSNFPLVISGHIHSHQWVKDEENDSLVYYPGSSMQHAFGESEKNIIPVITFTDNNYDIVEHNLGLPRKKIIYLDIDNVDEYVPPETKDKIKLTLSGNYEEFKTFRKTEKYKELTNKGIKLVYKHSKKEKKIEDNTVLDVTDFNKILYELVVRDKNDFLMSEYNHVILNHKKNEEVLLI